MTDPGNDVRATLNDLFFTFILLFFLRLIFSNKECLGLKTYLAKVDGSAQKPRGSPLSRPRRPFWGPLVANLDFAGGEQVPPSLLGWYSVSKNMNA